MRTSVIALIPPTLGIKATLATSGQSRVVLENNGTFQVTPLVRPPESTALTSPREATGLFELSPQSPELLSPFEYLGVATNWELRLPKPANPFDFDTIADVLLTFEYTALDSLDYRREVISKLSDTISADRPFSFRIEFADAWYDLHNTPPDEPLSVKFKIRKSDFLPTLQDLAIEHLVLFFSRPNVSSATYELHGVGLELNPVDGTPVTADTINGIISTRRINGDKWKNEFVGEKAQRSPIGEWTLNLPDFLSDGRNTRIAFKNEEFTDILFVVTYTGRTSNWPS